MQSCSTCSFHLHNEPRFWDIANTLLSRADILYACLFNAHSGCAMRGSEGGTFAASIPLARSLARLLQDRLLRRRRRTRYLERRGYLSRRG